MAGDYRNIPKSARAAFRLPSGAVCWLDESDIWFVTPEDEEVLRSLRYFDRIYLRYGQRFPGRDYDPDPSWTQAEFVRRMMGGSDLWVARQPFRSDLLY